MKIAYSLALGAGLLALTGFGSTCTPDIVDPGAPGGTSGVNVNHQLFRLLPYKGDFLRLEDLTLGKPDACDSLHWHSHTGVLGLSGNRYADPAPYACGYCKVKDCPTVLRYVNMDCYMGTRPCNILGVDSAGSEQFKKNREALGLTGERPRPLPFGGAPFSQEELEEYFLNGKKFPGLDGNGADTSQQALEEYIEKQAEKGRKVTPPDVFKQPQPDDFLPDDWYVL